MKIGLIDVDGHNFPNFALMRISGYHKANGDDVEWAVKSDMFVQKRYNRIYASKIFTFSNDFDRQDYSTDEYVLGGTGYDIKSRLAPEIESSLKMDYTLYPQYPFSIQFFSRGCIRKCPFCLVNEKEGGIHPVEPVELNPNGQWIEVLDNNFFANPKWRDAIDYLVKAKQRVKFHGVDVRIMDDEQAEALNKLQLIAGTINIAWDLPNMDLRPQLNAMVRHIKPYKISCYILIGFNSTREQDLYRARTLKELNIVPYAQAYRDFENKRKPSQYEKDFCRWCNNRFFRDIDFMDFEPRKGFKCSSYFNHKEDEKCSNDIKTLKEQVNPIVYAPRMLTMERTEQEKMRRHLYGDKGAKFKSGMSKVFVSRKDNLSNTITSIDEHLILILEAI